MNERKARLLVKKAVAKAGCEVKELVFEGDDLVIVVGRGDERFVGREYGWARLGDDELALRVYRFCVHYGQRRAYHTGDTLPSLE